VVDFLQKIHPAVQALLAGLFTWALAALGATMVFMTKLLLQVSLPQPYR